MSRFIYIWKSKTFSIKSAYRTEGFLDLVNGPGDNSNCVGYSCFVRLSQFHSIVPCGKSVDYFLSSTSPLEMKFRLPDVQSTCKVKVNFYTKRPNRIDLLLDGAFKVRLKKRISNIFDRDYNRISNCYFEPF